MMDLERRAFLKLLGIGTAGGAVLAHPAVGSAAGVAVLMRKKPEPLPAVRSGDPMVAATWNALVERVNALSEAR